MQVQDHVSPIDAMDELYRAEASLGGNGRYFVVGLPGHEMDPAIQEAKKEHALGTHSEYGSHAYNVPWAPDKLKEEIARFHNTHFDTAFTPEQCGFTPGSTPILNLAVQNMPDTGTCAVMFHPGYPQIKKYTAEKNVSVDDSPGFDVVDEAQGKRRYSPQTDMLRNTLRKRALPAEEGGAALLYLNFPSNPVGCAPTRDEYRAIAEAAGEDALRRKEKGLPPLEILEDQAYMMMIPERERRVSFTQALKDAEGRLPEGKEGDAMRAAYATVRQHTVITHSLSKAFAIPGERVAYFICEDPEKTAEYERKISNFMLTPSTGSFVSAHAALTKAAIDTGAMEEYNERREMLENGLNKAALLCGKETPPPVAAGADAGFFCAVNAAFLKGRSFTEEETRRKNNAVQAVKNPKIRSFLENCMQDGTVQNAGDAAIWLAVAAGVYAVPVQARDEGEMLLRFSVGNTSKEDISYALTGLEAALASGLKRPRDNGRTETEEKYPAAKFPRPFADAAGKAAFTQAALRQ